MKNQFADDREMREDEKSFHTGETGKQVEHQGI